jgi:biopolymer transport protein ExbD
MRGRGPVLRGPERADPNLVPLLDVVLQLIMFFMMVVHIGTKLEGATGEVKLPVAAAAWPRGALPGDRLVAVVDSAGRIRSEGGWLEALAQRGWWLEEARIRRRGLELLAAEGVEGTGAGEGGGGQGLPTVVLVRGDRALRHGELRRILQEAQAAGFERFSLIVERRGR